MNKKTILFLGNFPLDLENPQGGIESVLSDIFYYIKNDRKMDYKPIIATVRQDIPEDKVVIVGGIELRYYKGRPIPQTLNNFLDEKKLSLQAIRETNPDVINAHNLTGYSLAAIASGKPHLITFHSDPLREINLREKNLIKRWMKKILWGIPLHSILRKGQAFSWISEVYQLKYSGKLVDRKHFFIPNPVSNGYYHLRRKSSGKEKVVLYASRISPEKNIRIFFQTAQIASERHPELKFILAGGMDSGFKDEFHDCIAEFIHLIGTKILYLGHIPRKDLLAVYSNSYIYFHPSNQEISSTSILQAMAASIPIVASDIPGNRELLYKESSGILIDKNTPQAYAGAISELISNKKLYTKIQAHAKEASKKYQLKTVGKLYIDACMNLIDEK